MVTWEITAAYEGQRLNKYLMRKLPQAQSSFVYRMLRKKNITLNKKKASGSELLKAGDLVTLFLSDETISKFGGSADCHRGHPDETGRDQQSRITRAGRDDYLRAYHRLDRRIGAKGILFENAHVLAVVKPVGVLSQKAQADDLSMNEWLIGLLLEKGEVTEQSLTEFRPSVCNRLDRNTGGILLCAKTLQGARALTQVIRDRSLRKFYRAVVAGHLDGEGVIEGILIKDHARNKVSFEQTDGADKAANSRTLYKSVYAGSRYSLVEMELVTGRTHQLRSHLASTGHPIAGDAKYGDRRANDDLRERFGVRGQLLWCCRVVFPEMSGVLAPLSGKEICADPPVLYDRIVHA